VVENRLGVFCLGVVFGRFDIGIPSSVLTIFRQTMIGRHL
jgi:hypothetical protein